MKALLVHLSGSLRGNTQTFGQESILIGCDPNCHVRFNAGIDDKTSARHAEIYFENCEYYLRDLGSAGGTFVNGHEVEEIILKEGDEIEFGEGGPKVRFHVEVAPGEVCKPFRVVYRDSVRKSQRFRQAGVRSTVGFFGEFSRGLLRQSTPTIRFISLVTMALIVYSILMSALVLVQWTFSHRKLEKEIVQLRKQLTSDRQSREMLEKEVAAERKRNAEMSFQQQSETQARLAALQEEEQKLREHLSQAQNDASVQTGEMSALRVRLNKTMQEIGSLEQERSLGERIIRQYQAGVCFIEGAYRFHDNAGNLLRYLGLDSVGEPLKDASGQTLYSTSGIAPVVQINYSGTGFLVSKEGLILTNRHVAQPWWEDVEVKALLKKGLIPRFEYLRAYFPAVESPFTLEVVKLSDQADLALLKTNLGSHQLPALKVDLSAKSAAPGQAVILLGYPTGLDALLARLDEKVVESVVSTTGPDPAKISRELSRRGMIRPLATQGHLSDILPNKLIYDAQTTHGGSGGPLFNARGKVIGVNFAILSDFGGANFGVPIQFGMELIR
jgi:S1-C subfamily serine protease